MTKSRNLSVFSVKEAYYQSWINNKDEKGTEIIIHLNNVRDGVRFDSLIFRGMRLPVFITEKDSEVILKSKLEAGIAKMPVEKEYTGKPDQLLYTFQGAKHSRLLKDIKRKETKYNTASD